MEFWRIGFSKVRNSWRFKIVRCYRSGLLKAPKQSSVDRKHILVCGEWKEKSCRMSNQSSRPRNIPAALSDAQGRGFSTRVRLLSLLGAIGLFVMYLKPPFGSAVLSRWSIIALFLWAVFDIVNFGFVLYRRRRLLREVKKADRIACVQCAYPLERAGAENVVCPECGKVQATKTSQKAWSEVEDV